VFCARARTDGADAPPPSLHSIGTEHEKFGFRKLDKRPIDYTEVKHLLEGLVRR
jgi:gamma-glutamylcysteine synthetase